MGAPALPPGLWERIRQMIRDEVGKLLRSGFLRSASIGEGGLTVRDGFIRVRSSDTTPGATGASTVYMGGLTPALPDGTLQPGLIMRRNDGTIAMALYDPNPGDDAYAQFLALWDRSQSIVVSDDTDSGQGLARPYVGVPLHRARYTDMPAVTDTDFVDVFDSGWFYKINARARATVRHTADNPDTAGEVRVLVDDVQVGDTVPVGFVLTTAYVGPFAVPDAAYTQHRIKIQARRTAGTGAVRLDALIWGTQS